MNARTDLDRDHILAVCLSLAAPTMPLSGHVVDRAARAIDRDAGGLGNQDGLMLAYPNEDQRDRVARALSRCGYATETGMVNDARRYGIRVTGWSTDALDLRALHLRRAAFHLGVHVTLEETAHQAIDAAAKQPVDADPTTTSYDVASKVTGQVLGRAITEAGSLIPLTHFPTDPTLADRVRYVQRLADHALSTIGDHYNTACIAAGTYIHARREHTNSTTDTKTAVPAGANANEVVDRQADTTARLQARAEARAFIADPVDSDAFLEAAAWAHDRHPDDAGAFALDYAREHRGTDRDRRPPPEQAYPAWRDTPSSAPQIAAADFPHPADTAVAPEAGPAQTPAVSSQGRAPRRPR